MIKAAKEVENKDLAIRLRDLAYWMVDKTLPYSTLDNPYELSVILDGVPNISIALGEHINLP